MRCTKRLLLCFLAIVAGVPSARADELGPVGEAALRFLKAIEASDEAEQAAVAADPGIDPVDVASTLWTWHVSDRSHPNGRTVGMDALRDFARRAADRPDARDLAKAVEVHAALPDEVVAAEERRRIAWGEALLVPRGAARADAFARLLGDHDALPPTFLSATLLARAGEAEEAAGRMTSAAARFAAAGRRADALPWPRLAVGAWEQSARSSAMLGDWASASSSLERSVAALEPLGQDDRTVNTLLNLALARRRQGRPEASHEAAARAEAVAVRRGLVPAARAARRMRAGARIEAGDWAEAEPLLRALEAESRAAGDASSASDARLDLALLLLRTGRFAEALTLTEPEIERLARAGPSAALAAVYRNTAVLYREMGRPEQALALHERALAVYQAIGDRTGAAAALFNLGTLAATVGRLDEARQRYRAVIASWREGGEVRDVALARVGLAALERQASRPQEALALCVEAVTALEAAWHPIPAVVFLGMAEAHEALGRGADALSAYERAVGAALTGGVDAGIASRVLQRAAAAFARAGRAADALPLAERCLVLRRDAAEGFDPVEGEALGSRVVEVADLGVSLVATLRASGSLGEVEAVDRAFRFAEWGRAVALADALAAPGKGLALGLSDDLREADARSRADVDRTRARLERALSRKATVEIDDARAQLTVAATARDEVVARLHRVAGMAAAVTWPEPPDAATTRGLLRPDEAFVIYQRSPDRLRAIVLRATGGALVDLGPAADLEASVESWLRLASVPGGPEETLARRLGSLLLDPLAPHLAGARAWIVAPAGVLAFLPFDALRVGPSGARVVERATVTLAPSASVLLALRKASLARPQGTRVLALGDPTVAPTASERGEALGFARATALPASGEEARAVAVLFPEGGRTLLLGNAATVKGLRAALATPGGAFRAVHLACHARLDPEHPRLSGLLLAGGEVLDLDDVHRLRIDADVVVLSGCETGRGRLLTSEGVLGLTRGFFVAGAHRVVASAWKVEDASTLDLMRRFHEALAAGASPAEALARAKRETLALGGTAAHPSRWAAFSLWGEAH